MTALSEQRHDHVRATEAGVAAERFERKFYLPASKVRFAGHLLAHCCPRDSEYPEGTVNSVYYDTPDLAFYHESDSGSHDRKKVRIRWYDHPGPSEAAARVFLELKTKRGYTSMKQRREFAVPAASLDLAGMRRGVLGELEVRQGLADFGFFPDAALKPMVLVSYRRQRFVDITTGTRVSLDWDISSLLVSPRLDRREGRLLMQGGVIELKGGSKDIPPALQSMRVLGTDWSRFSKYGSCMETQMETPGTAGRFWPSGRVESY